MCSIRALQVHELRGHIYSVCIYIYMCMRQEGEFWTTRRGVLDDKKGSFAQQCKTLNGY